MIFDGFPATNADLTRWLWQRSLEFNLSASWAFDSSYLLKAVMVLTGSSVVFPWFRELEQWERCCEVFDCPALSLSLSLVRVHAFCDALYPSCSVAVTTRAFHTSASQHPCIPMWYRSAGHTINRPWRMMTAVVLPKTKAEYYIWYDTFDSSPSSRTRSSSALHQNDVRSY